MDYFAKPGKYITEEQVIPSSTLLQTAWKHSISLKVKHILTSEGIGSSIISCSLETYRLFSVSTARAL
jgi:hypothetical protein